MGIIGRSRRRSCMAKGARMQRKVLRIWIGFRARGRSMEHRMRMIRMERWRWGEMREGRRHHEQYFPAVEEIAEIKDWRARRRIRRDDVQADRPANGSTAVWMVRTL